VKALTKRARERQKKGSQRGIVWRLRHVIEAKALFDWRATRSKPFVERISKIGARVKTAINQS
jgi:hypothetical protein